AEFLDRTGGERVPAPPDARDIETADVEFEVVAWWRHEGEGEAAVGPGRLRRWIDPDDPFFQPAAGIGSCGVAAPPVDVDRTGGEGRAAALFDAATADGDGAASPRIVAR